MVYKEQANAEAGRESRGAAGAGGTQRGRLFSPFARPYISVAEGSGCLRGSLHTRSSEESSQKPVLLL